MSARSEEREAFLQDVITTAVEGGIGYWSQCSHYQWVHWDDGRVMVTVGQRGDRTDCYAVVHEVNDDESGYKEEALEINVEVIARGLRLLLDKQLVNSRMRNSIGQADRENDAGYIDSDDADAIVQAGLLGEVRYG